MFRIPLRRVTLLAALLPLALGVAACKKDDAVASGDTAAAALAKVPPPAGKAWSDVIAATPEGGVRMGNPDAPIKLVEYGSLSCPHCAEFAKESADSLPHEFVDTGRVSFEFRDIIRNPLDMSAVMLVRCAPLENFFALAHATFANQPAMYDKLKAAGDPAYAKAVALPDKQRFIALAQLGGLEDFFASNGLPKAQGETCLANTDTATVLAKRNEDAGKQGIDSTPTIFINDEKLDTPLWEDTKAKLEAMGAR
jgi:protein-disulfide isomerase